MSSAYSENKTTFEAELALLLSAPSQPSKKRRSAEEDGTAPKRMRPEPESASPDIVQVHPARGELLDLSASSNIQELGHHHDGRTFKGRKPTRNGSREPENHMRTWRTPANTVKRPRDSRKDDLNYNFLLYQRRKEQLSKVDRYVPRIPVGPRGLPIRPRDLPQRRVHFPL